jgi:hypothetical protein
MKRDGLVEDVVDGLADECAEVQKLGMQAVQQCHQIVALTRVLAVEQLEHLRVM